MKKKKNEVWLNLGCGIRLLKDFINVDNYFNYDDLKEAKGEFENAIIDDGAEFVKADVRNLPFPDNYADYIMVCYMIEHLPMSDIVPALVEWRRVLKPKGELIVTTVDFDELAYLWVTHVRNQPFDEQLIKVLSETIYGNQAGDGEFHCTPLNHDILARAFAESGFPYFIISSHPTNSVMPEIKGYNINKEGYVCLTTELHVKAFKTIPANVDTKKVEKI